MSEMTMVPKEEWESLNKMVQFIYKKLNNKPTGKAWLTHDEAVDYLGGLTTKKSLHHKVQKWREAGIIRQEQERGRKMYSRLFLDLLLEHGEEKAMQLYKIKK